MTAALLTPARASSHDEALSRFAREARNRRLDADAQHDYGLALLLSGRAAEAVEWFQHAVNLKPRNVGFHTNLCAALHQSGQWGLAFGHAREAYRMEPTNILTVLNVAAFHYWFGEIPDAVDWYQRAIDIDPTHWQAWWSWIFMRDFTPISPEQALADRRKFNEAHQTPRRQFWRPHTNVPDPNRRIRIGLTGGDFRQHSSSYCWCPVFFEHLDRERFQVFSYAHVTYRDPITEWCQKMTNGWRDITREPDDHVIAEQIRRDEIDVLIDLGTFSEHSHLMAHLYKPAPIQITAWGHLTGTGLDGMDGLLVDPVMVPEGREWEMTEQPVRVPYAMGWYRPKELLPLLPRPERPLTFGYLGRVQKLDDPTVALWADLLHAYPGSRLLLKDAAYLHERPSTRTLERFEAWGIDPSRIELRGLSSRDDHLKTYDDVDVALDPLPQSGGATTMEALMMGVPTVTLRGERLVRRVSASTVTVAGFPEWVAEDIHQYVEITGRVNGLDRQMIRDTFLASHICDGAARTRAFEEAIRGLWRDWCLKQAA